MNDKDNSLSNEFYILLVCCFFIHFIYAAVFLITKINIMGISNIFSALLYLVLINVEKRRELSVPVTVFCLLEVMYNVVLGTICMGWESGFAIQLICAIPIIFFRLMKNIKVSCVITFIIAVIYLILKISCSANEPIYSLSDYYLLGIYIFNMGTSFTVIMFFPFIYCSNVENSQKSLIMMNKKLNILAKYDPLTNLLNRRSMKTEISKANYEYELLNKNFAFLLCDIDDFKKVNDTYGHDCGDYVLKEISNIISNSVRECDYVCRWGGEEILILLNDIKDDTISEIASRININLSKKTFKYDDTIISITLTIGISSSIKEKNTANMIKKADKNLYKGKNKGKNCVIYE